MRRVLGVPLGWPRSILVALLVALSTGGLVALAVEQFFTTGGGRDASPGPAIILGLIALMWMLGFGAALLTVMELVVPTGAGFSPSGSAGRSGRSGAPASAGNVPATVGTGRSWPSSYARASPPVSRA